MTAKLFLDTNIIVYAHDPSEPEKQARSIELMERLVRSNAAVISTQVLSEFANAVTKRISAPLTMKDTLIQVERLSRILPILPVTSFVILEALRGVVAHSLSLWDAQIWATARMNQVPVVLSEDFSSDSSVEGVRFLNPFDQKFAVDSLVWSP
jgi:predicted nucleic acid-binding protein